LTKRQESLQRAEDALKDKEMSFDSITIELEEARKNLSESISKKDYEALKEECEKKILSQESLPGTSVF